jgi:hypothetical protein
MIALPNAQVAWSQQRLPLKGYSHAILVLHLVFNSITTAPSLTYAYLTIIIMTIIVFETRIVILQPQLHSSGGPGLNWIRSTLCQHDGILRETYHRRDYYHRTVKISGSQISV